VLAPIAADLAGNEIRRVRGIVNGTTNFILSEMADGSGTFHEVLAIAQERGYAEADPSGDVEGRDAVNKLVILARLAFGQWLDPSTITDRPPKGSGGRGEPGITGVTTDELSAAAALGLRIRLLATATADDSGGVEAAVVPTAVPADSPLGLAGGVRNRIEVRARPVGDLGFDGAGAGGEATASAVLGDLIAIARGQASTWAGQPQADSGSTGDLLASGERAWFTFLPSRGSGVKAASGLPGAEVAELAGGIAFRTPPLSLSVARERFANAPTIYPIDD
jgi:homoserine dehydrogenase